MEFCTRSCLLPHVMAGSERSPSPALQRHLQGLPGFPTCCSQNLNPSVQTSDDPTMAYASLQGFIPPICQFHLPVGCHPVPFAPPILPPPLSQPPPSSQSISTFCFPTCLARTLLDQQHVHVTHHQHPLGPFMAAHRQLQQVTCALTALISRALARGQC